MKTCTFVKMGRANRWWGEFNKEQQDMKKNARCPSCSDKG